MKSSAHIQKPHYGISATSAATDAITSAIGTPPSTSRRVERLTSDAGFPDCRAHGTRIAYCLQVRTQRFRECRHHDPTRHAISTIAETQDQTRVWSRATYGGNCPVTQRMRISGTPPLLMCGRGGFAVTGPNASSGGGGTRGPASGRQDRNNSPSLHRTRAARRTERDEGDSRGGRPVSPARTSRTLARHHTSGAAQ